MARAHVSGAHSAPSVTVTRLETLSASRMAESIDGEAPPLTSVPRLTSTPSLSRRRALSMPERSIELLIGQCATVAPRSLSSVRSAASR